MPRTFQQVVSELAELTAEDFDSRISSAKGHELLIGLAEDLMALDRPERGVRPLFDFMERMPDTDLGSPGPLVHALERMTGHYEAELIASLSRRPTFLTLWMANRILNATRIPEQRQIYVNALREASNHSEASAALKSTANRFIQNQEKIS